MRDGFHDPDAGTTEVERDDRDRTFNEYSDDISEGGEGPSTMDRRDVVIGDEAMRRATADGGAEIVEWIAAHPDCTVEWGHDYILIQSRDGDAPSKELADNIRKVWHA